MLKNPADTVQLFLATVAGTAGLSKTKWPSTYTVTLPAVGLGGVAPLTEGGAVVGGVFSPRRDWDSVALDFAAVGSADQTLTVEIGKLTDTGRMPQVIASVALKSITTTGTFTASLNPFTGEAASGTYRLFDLATITNRGNLGQLLASHGGTEDNTPCQLLLDVTDSAFYYALVTSLGSLTGPATCCITPQA